MSAAEGLEASLAAKFGALFPHLNKRQRRLVMGAEARVIGHGGIKLVARAAGVGVVTVSRGVRDLDSGEEPLDRVRKPGGGRKRLVDLNPGPRPALLALPEKARQRHRVAKKMLAAQFEDQAPADARLLIKAVASAQLAGILRPETIQVPRYQDGERVVVDVPVLEAFLADKTSTSDRTIGPAWPNPSTAAWPSRWCFSPTCPTAPRPSRWRSAM